MSRRGVSLCGLAAAVAVWSAALTISTRAGELPAAAARLPQTTAAAKPGTYLGPGACAAEACHGSMRPLANARSGQTTRRPILQTEHTTWAGRDLHHRAFDVLSNQVSTQMAAILKIGDARTASKCLVCHALDPQAAPAHNADGVSCEACHGPASGWLVAHYSKGWDDRPRAEKSALGLVDTTDLVVRTEQCLTCHLGTADKFVDHEMIAAGHPDLVFDLEAFSTGMPRHWREPEENSPVRVFSVGQLVHVRASLARLERRVKGPIWPEYGELDCFSCHHSVPPSSSGLPPRMSAQAGDSWRQAQGYEGRQPGNPALNQSRWATARHVLAASDAQAASELAGIMTSLAAEASRLRPNAAEVATLAGRARTILDGAISKVNAPQDAALAGKLFQAIVGDVDAIAASGERTARQAALALESLYSARVGAGKESASVRSEFEALFRYLGTPSSYTPSRFVELVKKIDAAVR